MGSERREHSLFPGTESFHWDILFMGHLLLHPRLENFSLIPGETGPIEKAADGFTEGLVWLGINATHLWYRSCSWTEKWKLTGLADSFTFVGDSNS